MLDISCRNLSRALLAARFLHKHQEFRLSNHCYLFNYTFKYFFYISLFYANTTLKVNGTMQYSKLLMCFI
ncbi:hypothetical protein XENTR_v10006356 [Xenopus tropicalis]|nr:hypothetical protein XENTR_v10006356 [Xenopus tropicalis]